MSFHQNTAENLTQYKTSSDVLRGIETSIAESLSTCPDDYLTPLFQTLSPTQLKEFEKKHEGTGHPTLHQHNHPHHPPPPLQQKYNLRIQE